MVGGKPQYPMIRLPAAPSAHDPLVQLLRQTCYRESAGEVAALLRGMIASYHVADRDEGDERAVELSGQVPGTVPSARLKGHVGLAETYEVRVGATLYRFTWQSKLARGCYNHVYYGNLTNVQSLGPGAVPMPSVVDGRAASSEQVEPVVVKITARPESDLRVYLLENVLHALLCALPVTRDMVVPIRFAFKLSQNHRQVYRLGVVLDDPGHGHLGEWIVRKHQEVLRTGQTCAAELFAILCNVAHLLHDAQAALQFQHRDLKCDNVMWTRASADRATVHLAEQGCTVSYLTRGIRCQLIDFGMARFVYRGEYLACDCLHQDTAFNRANDLQNFCCTLVEDYGAELEVMAPSFYNWLQGLCAPLFESAAKLVRQSDKTYANLSPSDQHHVLTQAVSQEQLQPFVPASMLVILQEYWKKRGI